MKTTSILQNAVIQKMSDFMDRRPGLVSLTITLIIIVGFIG